jgi:excinuclease UvrABC nuclease subunit
MPIGPKQGGFPFTEPSIRASAPNSSGVYAIFNQTEWIYIGESNDVQRKLLEHLRETGSCINQHSPTGFVIESLGAGVRVVHQDALILEYRPLCNARLG